jgi:hypothetical protein
MEQLTIIIATTPSTPNAATMTTIAIDVLVIQFFESCLVLINNYKKITFLNNFHYNKPLK